MKILLLNQAFHPDVASTAQHLTDLAEALVCDGHDVSVVCSTRGYDNPKTRYPSFEVWKGIKIYRIPSLRLSKASRWQRGTDFASFMTVCAARLVLLPRFDVVVALTTPPLITALGAFSVRLKGGRLVSWMMDLN